MVKPEVVRDEGSKHPFYYLRIGKKEYVIRHDGELQGTIRGMFDFVIQRNKELKEEKCQ